MIGNNLLLTHNLNDIGRKLSIELRNDYSNQASGNYQQSSITYYQLKNDLGADSVLYRNQYRESPARNLLLAGGGQLYGANRKTNASGLLSA